MKSESEAGTGSSDGRVGAHGVAADSQLSSRTTETDSAKTSSKGADQTSNQAGVPASPVESGALACSVHALKCWCLASGGFSSPVQIALSLNVLGSSAQAAETQPSLADSATPQLRFEPCALPPVTSSISYPANSDATTLQRSKYKYVSSLDYKENKQWRHFRVGREMVCVPRGHKDSVTARVGAIAVHTRPATKPTNKPRLDVEIVLVSGEEARGHKPSVFQPESKQPTTDDLTGDQRSKLVATARRWVYDQHVRKAEERALKKAELAALRAQQKQQRTRGSAANGVGPPSASAGSSSAHPPTPFPAAEMRQVLKEALNPLKSSLTTALSVFSPALTASTTRSEHDHGMPPAGESAAQAPVQAAALGVTPPSSMPPFYPSLSPSAPLFTFQHPSQMPYLAAAFAHSQMSALHLAQESYLLSQALSAAQMPSPAQGHAPSPPLMLMPPLPSSAELQHASSAQTAAQTGTETGTETETEIETRPRGRKRRRR